MANRRLREDLEEINTCYQELIVVSKEALKRKRKTQSKFEELNQKIQYVTQQNQELSTRVEDLEVEQQRTRRKSQDLEGIALMAEEAKDISKIISDRCHIVNFCKRLIVYFVKQSFCSSFESCI